ncbi:cell division protein DivIVA [Gardnerella vaginalis]|uniref:Cell division protein DivIVA n=1 Tax=Gardnerella vaginalis TaxID=2702 RepID=A0A3E1J014_GARVA|nr:cell division protein DivIVA [Gardnerella vaginalis]RFD79674.1 cell division protein DivIVA [Gardnerella vaginalis]
MAQKPDTARNASGMERVGKRKLGYNVAQVDAFLERAHALYESDDIRLTQQDIQDVSFDLEHDGYVIGQVDAALSRLERAVVDKCTQHDLSKCGRVVWKAQADALYRKLLQHAQRDYRERFASGIPHRPSYSRKQVDIMVDQALDKIANMLGHKLEWETDDDTLQTIDAMYVSNVIFTQCTGKRGYDERQVDYYLGTCIRLLSSLESFERIAQYVDIDSKVPAFAAHNTVSHTRAAVDTNHTTESKNQSAPSFAPEPVATMSATVTSAAAADAADSMAAEASEVASKVASKAAQPTQTSTIPHVPDYDKQSIFTPVDYVNQGSEDSFEALRQSERSIFTPHTAAGVPSNMLDDNTDSNDELVQSATVLHNVSENNHASVGSVDAADYAPLPPAFPPVVHRHAATASHRDVDDQVASSAIPSFPPALREASASASQAAADTAYGNQAPVVSPAPVAPIFPVASAHEDASHTGASSKSSSYDMPILNVQPSKPLNLDIPDLSFPIMGHVDESSLFDNAQDIAQEDDDDATGEHPLQ